METEQLGLRLQKKLVQKYKKRANELGVSHMDLIKIVLAKGIDEI